MNEAELEEVWTGRFTDTIGDSYQQMAKSSLTWQEFLHKVKVYEEEIHNDY